jgi:chloramphenicol-sensitive protein RarD
VSLIFGGPSGELLGRCAVASAIEGGTTLSDGSGSELGDGESPSLPSSGTAPSPQAHGVDHPSGFAYGIAAYGLWGIIPLYFDLLRARHLQPLPILAHRVVWSFLVIAALVTASGLWGEVRKALTRRRTVLMLVASAILIAANWLAYIYAVTSREIVQASLGYFITPLANVALGVTLLGERMRRLQLAALIVAAAGVVLLTVEAGRLPWISLTLAVSFSLYGLVRKTAAAEALTGLFCETMFLTPLAVGYLAWLAWQAPAGVSAGFDDSHSLWLLMLGGPVTTVPLLCFAAGARRLRMTTLGFLQFLAPTIQFVIAVLVFKEQIEPAEKWAMPFIAVAVAAYVADAVLVRRRAEATA